MNRDLVEIIARYAILLEQADESELPLETAVRHQESLAFHLQRLSPEERRQFIQLLSEVASGVSSEEEREILSRLPDDVGIR
jgi:hypothetical protein